MGRTKAKTLNSKELMLERVRICEGVKLEWEAWGNACRCERLIRDQREIIAKAEAIIANVEQKHAEAPAQIEASGKALAKARANLKTHDSRKDIEKLLKVATQLQLAELKKAAAREQVKS